jgi:hypothetical protein
MKINRGSMRLPGSVRVFIMASASCILISGGCGGKRSTDQTHPLQIAAAQFNAGCPKMIDPDTRLDSASFVSDTLFRYDYTLVNHDAENVDAAGLARYLKPRIMSNVSLNPEMRVQRDHRVTMLFYYRDRKGAFVTQVRLSSGEY